MKNKIIENIHNYMSENDILRDYETYEQMSVIGDHGVGSNDHFSR